MAKIALYLERDFNEDLAADRNGKFKEVNDEFYEGMVKGVRLSRFKIYVSKIFSGLAQKASASQELAVLKKASKNISSIITTNYDDFLEVFFEFSPLVGNDILLSNPYGSVYKIHGCVSDPGKIIITSGDYERFSSQYELIRAQLLSIFMHNPIVFLGYGIGDPNIKSLLKTIFTYVDYKSGQAAKIRDNFLLVEYEAGSGSREVVEHDIDIEGLTTIRINKIKTDDFCSIYEPMSSLVLPVSAMDIRKVQSVVRDIYAGVGGKVSVTEDLDSLSNGDKVIAIGSSKTIKYHFLTLSEMMKDYFKIIDESNDRILELINKHKISKGQYFPVWGFGLIFPGINDLEGLKERQRAMLDELVERVAARHRTQHHRIQLILDDVEVASTYKCGSIIWSVLQGGIPLDEVREYLVAHMDKNSSEYRKVLCAYDYMRFK